MYNEKNLKHGNLDYTVIQQVMDYGLIDLEASLRSSSYVFPGSFPTLIEKEGEHGDQSLQPILILSDHLPVLVDINISVEES